MSNQWTPGPWKAVEDAQGICGLIDPQKHGIAVAWFSSAHSPSNGYVGDEKCEVGRPERQANAHLISAAPDLYHALEGVLRIADRETVEFDKARAALAKARGESA